MSSQPAGLAPSALDCAQQGADELVAAAHRMIPDLIARAPEDEQRRRLDPRTIDDIRSGGFVRVLQPRRWGGFELDPSDFAKMHIALAQGDMSAAWVFSVYVGHAFHLALFDERIQEKVWGENSDALIASSYAPSGKAVPVEGGYRLTGHWKFSSGSDYSDWLMLGAITQEDPADHKVFVIRRQDCEVIDAWRVMGLKATGSQDVRVTDLFVPAYATLSHIDNLNEDLPGRRTNPGPLYLMPNIQLFFRSITTGCIGGLQAMLDAFIAYGSTKRDKRGNALVENPDAQLVCAKAALALDEMKATLFRNLQTLSDSAAAGVRPGVHERLLMRAQASEVSGRCLIHARALFSALGGSAIYEDSLPFGRIMRNLEAASVHPTGNFNSVARGLGAFLLTGASQDTMI